MGLRTKEGTDGRMHTMCPNCSRMYSTTNEKGEQQDIPGKCRRCGCPMDERKALEFSEEQARKGHNPALSELGNRMRGLTHPPMDRQVKAAATK